MYYRQISCFKFKNVDLFDRSILDPHTHKMYDPFRSPPPLNPIPLLSSPPPPPLKEKFRLLLLPENFHS